MKNLITVLAAVALVACAANKQPEYIVRPDGPRLSRQAAQDFLVEKSLTSQIRVPLDAPLKVVAAPLPAYPAELRRGANAIDGSVNVTFLVSADGSVSDVALVGQPNPVLANLCLASMLRWKFGPIARNGAPTTQKLAFEFVFRLED
jgi:TonB family protein